MSAGVLHVRLDSETRRALELLREESGLETVSAALRVALSLGLERTEKMSTAMKRAVYSEATIAAHANLKKKIGIALNEALGEFTE